MINLSKPHRQSPLAIVLFAVKTIKSIGIAQFLILVLVIRGIIVGPWLALVLALTVLGLAVTPTLTWWHSTFQLVDGKLIVTRGILRRDRLTVPIDRVQSITSDQQVLQRITGLVQITISTAGAAEAEVEFAAVGREIADELQRQVLTDLIDPTITTPVKPLENDDYVVFQHPPRRLLMTAITSAPLSALITLAPLLALAQRFNQQIIDAIPAVRSHFFQTWWVPILVAVAFMTIVVLNLVAMLVHNWKLTLRTGPNMLRRTAGLFSRISGAIRPTRVQVLTTKSNPLQRSAGVSTIRLSSIGGDDLSLIGCDDDQIIRVFELVGMIPPSRSSLKRRIERAEIWLEVRNTSFLTIVIALAGWFYLGLWSLMALAAIPVVLIARSYHVRTFRWSLDSALATHTHVLTRSTRQALLCKANRVQVTQSMFERRRGLGRLHLNTAAGTVSVGMIPIEEAQAARDLILFTAETSNRPWM